VILYSIAAPEHLPTSMLAFGNKRGKSTCARDRNKARLVSNSVERLAALHVSRTEGKGSAEMSAQYLINGQIF
jgi:hypothetical protein